MSTYASFICSFLFLILFAISCHGQVSPEEHKKHHPKAEAGKTDGKQKAGMMGKGGMGGGKGGGMGGMMKKMGVPPPKDLYPSLMAIRHLSHKERKNLETKAHDRMRVGATLLGTGLTDLSRLASSDDFVGMEEAVGVMKEGVAEFESGLATHRALVEGKVPSRVALRWFKDEMNLGSQDSSRRTGGLFGLSYFHLSMMLILTLFAVAMVGMYFFKMKRAHDLLDRLSTASSSPIQTGESDRKETKESKATPEVSWPEKLEVVGVFKETDSVSTFRLARPDNSALSLPFVAGQFLTLEVEIDGKKARRSYTISSSPSRPYLELTIKREEKGLVSAYLHKTLASGTMLRVLPAAGRFTFDSEKYKSVVLVSGGVGATPMMSIARDLTEKSWPGEIFYVHCARNLDDFIFRDELEQMAKRHSNLKLVVSLTAETRKKWKGRKGRFSADMLSEEIPDITSRQVHICGPAPMMDAVTQLLDDLNVPKEQIHKEAFGSPKKKAIPQATSNSSQATDDSSQGNSVTFVASKKSSSMKGHESVLDLADEIGVEIDSSCRTGVCGACSVKLVEGEVTMDVDDGLSDDDKIAGLILACQSKPKTDLKIDA